MSYNTRYTNINLEKLNEILDAKLPSIQNFLKILGNNGLTYQSRLFFDFEGHPEALGSVTFIKYNFNYYVLTNNHCLKNGINYPDYFTYIPMKKSKKFKENERKKVPLTFIKNDENLDLAVFKCDHSIIKKSRRNFFELYPYTENDYKNSPLALIIGTPGERLGYYYSANNTDYSNLEKIIMNSITYLTLIETFYEDYYELSIAQENKITGHILINAVEENEVLFGDGILKSGKLNSIEGLSGSPCFNFNFKKLNNFKLHYLGMVSNGTVESGKVYVISVEKIKTFLNSIPRK